MTQDPGHSAGQFQHSFWLRCFSTLRYTKLYICRWMMTRWTRARTIDGWRRRKRGVRRHISPSCPRANTRGLEDWCAFHVRAFSSYTLLMYGEDMKVSHTKQACCSILARHKMEKRRSSLVGCYHSFLSFLQKKRKVHGEMQSLECRFKASCETSLLICTSQKGKASQFTCWTLSSYCKKKGEKKMICKKWKQGRKKKKQTWEPVARVGIYWHVQHRHCVFPSDDCWHAHFPALFFTSTNVCGSRCLLLNLTHSKLLTTQLLVQPERERKF